MQTPIDATSTPAWGTLSGLKSRFADGPHKLRRLFDADPHRAERYTLDVADLHVDLSKNLLTDEIRDCLLYTSPSPRDLSTSRMPSSA